MKYSGIIQIILSVILFFLSGGIFAQDPLLSEPVKKTILDLYFSFIPEWMNDSVLTLKTWQWMGLFIAVILGMIVRTLSGIIAGFSFKIFKNTQNEFNARFLKEIKKPIGLLILSWFWIASIHILLIEGAAYKFLQIILQIMYSAGFIWFFYRFSDIIIEYLRILTNKTESTLDDHLVPLVNKTIKVSIVIFGSLITFQNLGINVMSLLAGLGIGGLAFALAAKDTVANFFGSLMIILDQPFQVGDWIIVKDKEGTVEEIGFRSTRIRTFYNSLISIPNAELMNAIVDNMGQRKYRRIKTFLGLKYDTPPENIESFIEGVKSIINSHPYTRKDYYHVVFNEYGPDSLIIMLYVFVEVPDWTEELRQRQDIFLKILKLAKAIPVEFAFPTQTLHLESLPDLPAEFPKKDSP